MHERYCPKHNSPSGFGSQQPRTPCRVMSYEIVCRSVRHCCCLFVVKCISVRASACVRLRCTVENELNWLLPWTLHDDLKIVPADLCWAFQIRVGCCVYELTTHIWEMLWKCGSEWCRRSMQRMQQILCKNKMPNAVAVELAFSDFPNAKNITFNILTIRFWCLYERNGIAKWGNFYFLMVGICWLNVEWTWNAPCVKPNKTKSIIESYNNVNGRRRRQRRRQTNRPKW